MLVSVFGGAGLAFTAEAEKNTTPVVAACYTSLQPVIALVIMCALGEASGARNVTGSVLIAVGGVFAVALSTNDRTRWKRWYPIGVDAAGVGREERAETRARRTVSSSTADGMRAKSRKTIPLPPSAGRDGDGGGTEVRRALGDEGSRSVRKKPTPSRGGTVRIVREKEHKESERPRLGAVAWTVAWMFVMSLCALAGGGVITWSLVWVYWKIFL